MEVARAKIYPAECLRMVYLKYFCVRSSVHSDISYSSAFRISVQLSIFPPDVLLRGFGETRDLTCSLRANRTFHLYLGCPMTSSSLVIYVR